MSGRTKGLKIKGQQALDPAVIAAAASAIPAPFHPNFHQVVEALPAAVYVTDAEGRITYYNKAAVELWGYRPTLGDSRWCGSWRLYRLDGTPMAHDECPMAMAIKENRAITGMEAYAERPDGSRVRFMPFPKPLHDETGTLIGAVNMLVDVTDRRSTEQRLDESETRYRGIFEGARVALWEEDFSAVLALLDELRAQGVSDLRAHLDSHPETLAHAIELVRITDVNEYSVELFAAERKDDLLSSLSRIFLPETQAVFVEELVALWEGRRRFESETTLRTLRGQRLNVLFTIAFEGDRCERTLVSILDISALKAAQRALREQKQRLKILNRVARTVSSDLDLERIVQTVTDVATEVSGAKFGAFFYKIGDNGSATYTLYALSGAARESLRHIRPAAQDDLVRADGPRIRSGPMRRYPQGSALWRDRAAFRPAGSGPARHELSRRAGGLEDWPGPGRPVPGPRRSRSLHPGDRGHRARHRGPCRHRHRQCAAAAQGADRSGAARPGGAGSAALRRHHRIPPRTPSSARTSMA